MDAGVIDQNLDRPCFEQLVQDGRRCSTLGDIKGNGFSAATNGGDQVDHRLRLFRAAVGMDDDMMAVSGKALADRSANAAAAAGDKGSFHEISFLVEFSG